MTAATPTPRVFNLPAGVRFVDALARGLVDDVPDLSRATVLLPTRRAVRALREAFLQVSDGAPLLLPLMRPIGDVDEEALVIESAAAPLDEAAPGALDVAPAVPALTRQLLLARLVLKWGEGRPGGVRDAAQASALARELGGFLDQVQTERLSFDALAGLVPADFAEHWQHTLEFLEIVTAHWPSILAERAGLDPAQRRNLLLETLAACWREAPPADPVIAAGSTGSIPATADLLAVVARLPQGAVILPGLDGTLDDDAWAAIGSTHPQFGIKQLLERLGVDRGEVEPWRGIEAAPELRPRIRLLSEVMRPADTTERWHDETGPPPGSGAEGLTRIDCATPREEAGVIALLMREALETSGRTAALVTPDRRLARRVAAELGRWDVGVDDSAGAPLNRTPPGAFLRLTAEMIAGGLAPVAVLAALKHPLAMGGLKPGVFRALVRRLEIKVLRGPRPAAGFDGLLMALPEGSGHDDLRTWLQGLQALATGFETAIGDRHASLAALVREHIGFSESLARTDTATGAERLWAGEAGEAMAGFVAEIAEAAPNLPPFAGSMYPALLKSLLAGQVVRPRYGVHPRLFIWGPLEARLQSADLLILGGLNEGNWPARADPDPWLSRPMREHFGLPLPERRIGLSAHDFTQAASTPEVILTRAEKDDGTPTVASRWWLRLNALIGKPAADEAHRADTWRAWQHALNAPAQVTPVAAPRFAPPVAARPRRLSVTDIETLLRDPYAVFARRILGLRPLDALEVDAGAAERGTLIHDALDAFVRAFPDELPDDAEAKLLDIGRGVFAPLLSRPGVVAFWWPRFERIAGWVVALERERRPDVAPLATEVWGRLTIAAPAGPFELIAKADRIDRTAGGLAIIDYKTGGIPSKTDFEAGLSPQLPLEAAIAEAGGFEGVPGDRIGDLAYWQLTGKAGTPGKIRIVSADGTELGAEARTGLEQLIAGFDDPAQPYLSQPQAAARPRFSDYDHLARRAEWASESGDGT